MALVRPMLCKPIEEADLARLNMAKYSAELKIDGMRAIAERNGMDVRVYGRSGIEYTKHLSKALTQSIIDTIPDNSIIDGELAHVDHYTWIGDLRVPVVDFNKTMRVMGSSPNVARQKATQWPIGFIAFDVVKIYGVDTLDDKFARRRDLLERWTSAYITPSWNLAAFNPQELYNEVINEKLEGLVIKDLTKPYLPGSRTTQMKIKAHKFYDVVVMGYEPGKGKFVGTIGALKFGAYDGDKLVPVGKCSGMTDYERQRWHMAIMGSPKDKLNGKVITIKAYDLVGSGEIRSPRHPQYAGIRDDKPAMECTLDQFKAE